MTFDTLFHELSRRLPALAAFTDAIYYEGLALRLSLPLATSRSAKCWHFTSNSPEIEAFNATQLFPTL